MNSIGIYHCKMQAALDVLDTTLIFNTNMINYLLTDNFTRKFAIIDAALCPKINYKSH